MRFCLLSGDRGGRSHAIHLSFYSLMEWMQRYEAQLVIYIQSDALDKKQTQFMTVIPRGWVEL